LETKVYNYNNSRTAQRISAGGCGSSFKWGAARQFPALGSERQGAGYGQLLHGYHLYWPDLDVDLEIDNLENPEKYPLKFESKKQITSHPTGRRAAAR